MRHILDLKTATCDLYIQAWIKIYQLSGKKESIFQTMTLPVKHNLGVHSLLLYLAYKKEL